SSCSRIVVEFKAGWSLRRILVQLGQLGPEPARRVELGDPHLGIVLEIGDSFVGIGDPGLPVGMERHCRACIVAFGLPIGDWPVSGMCELISALFCFIGGNTLLDGGSWLACNHG